jgi:hypothetical protein
VKAKTNKWQKLAEVFAGRKQESAVESVSMQIRELIATQQELNRPARAGRPCDVTPRVQGDDDVVD